MSMTGFGEVADLAKDVLGRFFPDKTEQERAQLAATLALIQGQMAVNQAEASNTSIFVAGWRPAVGWACAAAFAWNWCGLPIAKVIADMLGSHISLSAADMSEMMPVLLGMLGLGAMRSVEKIKGAEGNR